MCGVSVIQDTCEGLGHPPELLGHFTPVPRVEGGQVVEKGRRVYRVVGHDFSLVSVRRPGLRYAPSSGCCPCRYGMPTAYMLVSNSERHVAR